MHHVITVYIEFRPVLHLRNAFIDSLSSLWPGVSSGAGLSDSHWLPPLCLLEVLIRGSRREMKVVWGNPYIV